MSCTTCYEVILHACPDSIILKAGLAPATEYYWLIETRHSKIYQKKAVTDGDGTLTMDVSLLPAGMLNSSAGFFKLQIRQGTNYLALVPLTIEAQEYTCVQMKFQNTEGDAGINNHIYTEAA